MWLGDVFVGLPTNPEEECPVPDRLSHPRRLQRRFVVALQTLVFIASLMVPIARVSAAPPGICGFLVAVPPSSTAGAAFSMTVTAQDAGGTTLTTYTGQVTFSSSDPAAVLPANYTFTTGVGADNGVHTVETRANRPTLESRFGFVCIR